MQHQWERLLLGFGADSFKTVVTMATENMDIMEKNMSPHLIALTFDLILVKLAGNQDRHKISDEFGHI